MSIQETLLQKVQQQQKDIAQIREDMQYMRKQLFGNGVVGMDEHVRLNTFHREKTTGLDKQVEMNTKFREDMRKFLWTFLTLFLGQIVSVLAIWLK